MLAFKGKRMQLTAEESNQSRFVPKIRWVVESVHGMYRLLDHKIGNKLYLKCEVTLEMRHF